MKKKRLLEEIEKMQGFIDWYKKELEKVKIDSYNYAIIISDLSNKVSDLSELEVENQMLVGDSQTDAVIIADLTKKVSALREENNALIKSNQVLLERSIKKCGRK